MPYCPICQDEFRRGFSTCPDCRVELVEALATHEPEAPAGDLQQVWNFAHVAEEIDHVCSMLKANGVSTYLRENEVTVPWQTWSEVSATSMFRSQTRQAALLVASADVERAIHLIEESYSQEPSAEETSDRTDGAEWVDRDPAQSSFGWNSVAEVVGAGDFDPEPGPGETDEDRIGDTGGPPLAGR